MRCLVHDFAGHPFQAQLSRQLAIRGHEVVHVYPAGLPGPKGRLEKCASDPEKLRFKPLSLSRAFQKYSVHRRFSAQREYARDLKELIRSEEPDVVLSSNTPIDVQAELLWHCRRKQIGFVHWVQDVYCQALMFFLCRKFGSPWAALVLPFRIIEKWVTSASDATVVIAPEFQTFLAGWGIPKSKITVIENWAPLDEVPSMSKENAWRQEQQLDGRPVLLYSGTLGLKHRPDLLYILAKHLVDECRVIVVSEGIGREYLEKMPPLPNLTLVGFQPYARVPEVLATADVLLTTLEADAGQFAVPSKLLTYLCAGRALLLAAPKENLSACVIERSGGGVVVDPNDTSAWIAAARNLATDAAYRARLAASARRYAENTFDIAEIAQKFERVLVAAQRRYASEPATVSSASA